MDSIRGVRGLLYRVHLLHIFWNDDAGHGAFGGSDTHGAVNEVAYLHRAGSHVDVFSCYIFEQRDQVHFLLVVSSHGCSCRLSNNRDDWTMIHFRVVEAIEHMNGAWARGCQTNADLIRELGMGCCHECSRLFVAHLDKLKEVLVALQAAQNAVNPIAGVAKNTLDPPE